MAPHSLPWTRTSRESPAPSVSLSTCFDRILLSGRFSHPVLVYRLAPLRRASFRPHLAAGGISPLRFAITSSPSGCEEDLHLQAAGPAWRSKKKRSAILFALRF